MIKNNLKVFDNVDIAYDVACPFCKAEIGQMFWGKMTVNPGLARPEWQSEVFSSEPAPAFDAPAQRCACPHCGEALPEDLSTLPPYEAKDGERRRSDRRQDDRRQENDRRRTHVYWKEEDERRRSDRRQGDRRSGADRRELEMEAGPEEENSEQRQGDRRRAQRPVLYDRRRPGADRRERAARVQVDRKI